MCALIGICERCCAPFRGAALVLLLMAYCAPNQKHADSQGCNPALSLSNVWPMPTYRRCKQTHPRERGVVRDELAVVCGIFSYAYIDDASSLRRSPTPATRDLPLTPAPSPLLFDLLHLAWWLRDGPQARLSVAYFPEKPEVSFTPRCFSCYIWKITEGMYPVDGCWLTPPFRILCCALFCCSRCTDCLTHQFQGKGICEATRRQGPWQAVGLHNIQVILRAGLGCLRRLVSLCLFRPGRVWRFFLYVLLTR